MNENEPDLKNKKYKVTCFRQLIFIKNKHERKASGTSLNARITLYFGFFFGP